MRIDIPIPSFNHEHIVPLTIVLVYVIGFIALKAGSLNLQLEEHLLVGFRVLF